MFFNIISRFYSIVLGYLGVLLINKNYTFDLYGEYIMFIVYSSLLVTISSFGVSKSIISQKKLNLEKNYSFKNSIILIQFLLALLFTSLSSLFTVISFYMYIIVLIMTINEILKTYFLLENFNRIYSFSSYIIEQTSFVLILIISLSLVDNLHLIEISLISNFILFLFLFYFSIKLTILKMELKLSSINQLYLFYKKSSTYLFINIIQLLSENIDKILISKLLTNSEVGLYTTLEKVTRLSIAMFNAMSPLMMKKIVILRNSKEKLVATYSFYSSIATIISMPVSFIILYYSVDILNFFNNELVEYINIFYLLIIVRMIQYSTGFKAVMLQMIGLEKYEVLNNIIKLLINISIMYVLIEYFKIGLYGVTVALLISIVVFSSMQVYFIRKKYHIFYFQNIFYLLLPVHMIIYFISFSNFIIIFELIFFTLIYFFYIKKASKYVQ